MSCKCKNNYQREKEKESTREMMAVPEYPSFEILHVQ